ncbi:uncharacterized protein FA14DRAFT_153783 [Meira miltonrushii]|uniref:GH16 domain-containing protein n=1 Tax=Meira miltonrushii TaxID=1280837 RepID=A0A316VME5_9BASI|nr:uncharacterized protein FA14DRAFT_153783 [Meira miltonrushii]PWN38464.1 hypothetical protein FA14DRAFT_153783 [Meira miltonrushii]
MDEALATEIAGLGQEAPFALQIGVDNSTSNPPFRNSVKLQSNYLYGDGLYVLDLNHYPSGCGVWPAFWTMTANASSSQEIDIIQSVNDLREGPIIALHTDQQCQAGWIPGSMTGTFGEQMNCRQQNVNVSGCVGYYESLIHEPANIHGGTSEISARRSLSKKAQQGSTFGQTGRTVIVMQRDIQNSNGISAWAFNETGVPVNLNYTLSLAGNGNGQTNKSLAISTDNWPSPNVLFSLPQSSCKEQWERHFLVINIGLCGGWANTTYTSSGCAAQFDTCADQVASQVASFDNAFFSINSITVFASNNFNLNPVLLPGLPSGGERTLSTNQAHIFSILFAFIVLIILL